MPRPALKDIVDICHRYDVLVSTGGFLEYVIAQGSEAVGSYLEECKAIGFDIVEISCGFITIPVERLGPSCGKGQVGRSEGQA